MKILLLVICFIIFSCSSIMVPDSVSVEPLGDFSKCSSMLEYKNALDGSVLSLTWYLGYDYKSDSIVYRLWKYERGSL